MDAGVFGSRAPRPAAAPAPSVRLPAPAPAVGARRGLAAVRVPGRPDHDVRRAAADGPAARPRRAGHMAAGRPHAGSARARRRAGADAGVRWCRCRGGARRGVRVVLAGGQARVRAGGPGRRTRPNAGVRAGGRAGADGGVRWRGRAGAEAGRAGADGGVRWRGPAGAEAGVRAGGRPGADGGVRWRGPARAEADVRAGRYAGARVGVRRRRPAPAGRWPGAHRRDHGHGAAGRRARRQCTAATRRPSTSNSTRSSFAPSQRRR